VEDFEYIIYIFVLRLYFKDLIIIILFIRTILFCYHPYIFNWCYYCLVLPLNLT